MKNQGCVADAFLERFLGGPRRQKETAWSIRRSLLATIFHQKSKKWRQGSPNGAKSQKIRRLKIDAKNDAEKDEKMMQKGSQNDAKMDAKMDKKSMRFQNLRFLCFCKEYNVKIGFLHES